jgi:hypothetical protein
MGIIEFLILLAIVIVIAGAIINYLPIAQPRKNWVIVILLLILLLIVLQYFGVFDGLGHWHRY